MKLVFGFFWHSVLPWRRCIEFPGILAAKGLMRSVVIVNLHKAVKAFLLLQEIERCGLWSPLFLRSDAFAHDDRFAGDGRA